MRKIGVIAALALALVLFGGSGEPQPGVGGFVSSGARVGLGRNGIGVGKAKTDTIRILARDRRYPNSAAVAAGYVESDSSYYDIFTTGYLGEGIRYGNIMKGAPDSVLASRSAWSDYTIWTRLNSTEDDMTWAATQRLGFVWVTGSGFELGQRVESASLMVNVINGGGVTLGGPLYARLDTVSLDYRMLAGGTSGVYGSNNDAGRLDCTWNDLSQSQDTQWIPALDARDDYHDFGPRSANFIPAGVYAQGTCWRFDVTDAVQQAVDNGEAERGFLFIIYGLTGTTVFTISGGNSALVGSLGHGNPCFEAEVTSRRGVRQWFGMRAPLALIFDDAYNSQVGAYSGLKTWGQTFEAAICSTNWYARDWQDSVRVADGTDAFNFTMHTATHPSLGSLGPNQLDRELSRGWVNDFLTTPVDTAALIYLAWPGGAGTPVRSLGACERMVDFGYRAARSGGIPGELNTVTGRDVYWSWDSFVHRYLIWGLRGEYIFGNASGPTSTGPASYAQLKDNLTDYIDLYYTSQAKSAIVMYAHWYAEGANEDWFNEENVGWLAGLCDTLNCTEMVSFSQIVEMRLAGSSIVEPDVVVRNTVLAPDSTAIKAMADRQDSVYQIGGHDNVAEMWVAPRAATILQPPAYVEATVGYGAVSVGWTPVARAASYTVFRGSSAADLAEYAADVTTDYYADTSVSDTTTYCYAVAVVSATGHEGPLSEVAWATTEAVLAPAVENFSVAGLTAGGSDEVVVAVVAGFNKDVDPLLAGWPIGEAEPDTSEFDFVGAYDDTLNANITLAAVWATPDADSTVTISWAPGDPAPTSGYRLEVKYNNGAFVDLADTLTLSPADTSYTHTAASAVAVRRGKLVYRITAISAQYESAPLVSDPVYNDAMEMGFRLWCYDGTGWGFSAIESGIGVSYPEALGGGRHYTPSEP